MRSAPASLALTLGAAVSGAALATMIGLPAPALLGSTAAVSVAALLRVPMAMPPGLRNVAFTVIGCSLGSGITPHFFDDAARWPLSLGVLGVVMAVVMLCSSWLLVRVFGQSRETAILSTSPGALSYSLALAATGIGNVQAVMVMQSLRLLVITLGVPLALGVVGEEGAFWAGAARVHIGTMEAGAMLALAFGVGWLLTRAGLPAAFLLAGMAVSGALHAPGVVAGQFPGPLMDLGFTITGAVIGARFTGIRRKDLFDLAQASTCVVAVACAASAAFAAAVAQALSIPFGQAWVAYAPGGVEAMAAMALSLGYDPAFVATHHVFRLVLLLVLLPVTLRFARGRP